MQKQDIKKARETLGLNKTQMANVMGVSYGSWIKWERGEQAITAAPVRLIKTMLWLELLGLFNEYIWKFKGV